MKKSIRILSTTFFCAFLLFGSISSHAQFRFFTTNNSDFYYRFPPGTLAIAQDEKIPGVEGSQYLSDDWSKGRIELENGNMIDSIDLRLNVYKSEMHFLNKNVEYTIGNPEAIKEVTWGDRKFIYSHYKDGKSISQGYFEVLVEGNIELLAFYYIVRLKASYNKALDVGEKSDHLILNKRYYIANNSSIIEVDKKGKSIFESLGDKGDILRKRIKEEDLSFKKKEDLVKIVTYMNEIN